MYCKKLLNIVYLFFIVVFIAGCVSNTPNKAEAVKAINEAEKNLYENKDSLEFDKEKAQNLVDKYNNFTSNFADDPQSADYLFRTAEVLRSLKKFNEAVSVYSKIVKNYPNFDKLPHSLFLQGFSHENDLKNLDEAKVCYEDFLKRFPNHELADDVQFSLTNLGKSPEEIIEEFEKKRKENEGKEAAETTEGK